MKYKVEYNSNNSGGSWWLKDEDWYKLEEAGWEVEWRKTGRFLGALAKRAAKIIETDKEPSDIMKNILEEFEKLTNQNVCEEGCNCCGPPHSFTLYKVGEEEDEWINHGSGEKLLHFLYDEVPRSLREATEILNGRK